MAPPDSSFRPLRARLPVLAAWLGSSLLLACATPAPKPSSAPVAVTSAPMVALAPPAPPLPPAPPPSAEAGAAMVTALLAHADRLRGLSTPDLAQEITRLADNPASPVRQMQLALALLQTRVPTDGQRAQALFQRVLTQDTPEARPLHALARLVSTQYGEQRRAEEQLERQAQQLRDGQRRIDQLNDRLEALRAIERSMPSRQTH